MARLARQLGQPDGYHQWRARMGLAAQPLPDYPDQEPASDTPPDTL